MCSLLLYHVKLGATAFLCARGANLCVNQTGNVALLVLLMYYRLKAWMYPQVANVARTAQCRESMLDLNMYLYRYTYIEIHQYICIQIFYVKYVLGTLALRSVPQGCWTPGAGWSARPQTSAAGGRCHW